jgi:protein-S-isoprenylcysteine O-methyltransferase Ste14
MAAIDLVVMPAFKATIHLSSNWLTGEAIAIATILLPALFIARWTLTDTKLRLRATQQIAIATLLFLYLLPELAFALRPHSSQRWTPILTLPNWEDQLAIGAVFILAIPGIGAVFEFADRGHGTPIPYDPPQRLVTSGLYRYIANPMQLSCTAVMLLWAALLHNPWLILAAAFATVYSVGIAEWDEREDLDQRFGENWRSYRAQVQAWRPNLFPYTATHTPTPCLYIAGTCGPCAELRTWLESRYPQGLEIHPAEELPQGSIQRLRYDPNDGTPPTEGVRAFARALEHIHIGWALAGATLRLPVLWRFIQLVMDASGLGPREISNNQSQY